MAKQCTQCRAEMADTARFCGICGNALPADDSAAATMTDAGVPPAAEDDSWLTLAGEARPAEPIVSVVEPTQDVSPSPSTPPAAAEPPVEPHIARGADAAVSLPPLMPVDSAVPVADAAPPPPAIPPRERRTGRALWIIAIVLGLFAAGLIVAWTVSWTRGPSFATVATSNDDPVSPDEEWRAAYADQFIGEEPVTMITNASANVRDYPTTSGSQVLRSVPESGEISGRWVRGRDPATRWLKLADGGYIWDGNLATRDGANSPIRIPFGNRDFSFGPDIDRYMEQVRAQSLARSERIADLPEKERDQAYSQLADQSFFASVPNRRWRGLTVTAVGQHYESGSIYFRENIEAVRAAFRTANIRFDNDGIIYSNEEEPLSCSIGATEGDERAHGVSALTCGV